MFTGIVEEMGSVVQPGPRLVVECSKVAQDSEAGSSLAVNGVCLTVVDLDRSGGADGSATLAFDLSPETLARSSLGDLRKGSPVNLERPLTLMGRLGGHLVQGHVDGMGRVESVADAGTGTVMTVSPGDGLARYIVEKGSIAMQGVSLTVAGTEGTTFSVALVPFTLRATTLGSSAPGDRVNLEVDVVAKYVEAFTRRTG